MCFPRTGCVFQEPDARTIQRHDLVGCTAEHRHDPHNPGDTGVRGSEVCVAEMSTDGVVEPRPISVGAVSDRRAEPPMMRVRVRSIGVAVPQEENDSPKEGLVIAPPVLLQELHVRNEWKLQQNL